MRSAELAERLPFFKEGSLAVDIYKMIKSDSEYETIKRNRYDTGDVLYHANDDVCNVCLILSGMVKIQTVLPNGRVRIIRLHVQGNLLGFDGLLEQKNRHTAIAIGPVLVAKISLNSIRALEQSAPKEYCRILKEVYRHLVLADTWITEFSTGGIKSRVARLLRFLSDIKFGQGSKNIELLKTQEIAEILGITPESASRTIAEFKRNKALCKQPGQKLGHQDDIYQIDPIKLQQESIQ